MKEIYESTLLSERDRSGLTTPLFMKELPARCRPDGETSLALYSKSGDLSLRLTDEQDPLFLYELDLNLTSFAKLKAEQQLRVDFGGFAAKFSELVDLACFKEDKFPRFTIKLEKLEGNRLLFKLSEVNEFKELDHLVLFFTAANDERLKTYLASLVSSARSENKDMSFKLEGLRRTLEDSGRETLFLKDEVARVREEFRLYKETSRSEQEKHIQNTFTEANNTIFKANEQLMKERESARSTVAGLQAQVRDLKEQFDESLVREKDLQAKVRSLEAELTGVSCEVERQKRLVREAEARLTDADFSLSEARSRTEAETSKRLSVETELGEVKAARNAMNEARLRAEEQLLEKSKASDRLQSKLADSAAEIIKANELMEQFEAELKRRNGKIKELKASLARAEKELSSQSSDNSTTASRLAEASEKVAQLTATEAALRAQLQDAETRLRDAQKTAEIGQNTINFLNQKLNEGSRPFLKPSGDSPGWAQQTQLSSTAQAILSKHQETLSGPFLASGRDRSYLDSLKTKEDLGDQLLFLKTEGRRTTSAAPKALDASDDEVPRAPIAKTIQPVRFRSD